MQEQGKKEEEALSKAMDSFQLELRTDLEAVKAKGGPYQVLTCVLGFTGVVRAFFLRRDLWPCLPLFLLLVLLFAFAGSLICSVDQFIYLSLECNSPLICSTCVSCSQYCVLAHASLLTHKLRKEFVFQMNAR